MLKYSHFVTGNIQTVTHCWKRCLVHLAGVRQLMFYQLGVNDIHTISASACVLTRFPVYHPGNVVWFGVGEGILLIQVPVNLTKGSPIINVWVHEVMGQAERLGKETAGVGGKCSLCSLCFVAPSPEGRERDGDKPHLSLDSFSPGFSDGLWSSPWRGVRTPVKFQQCQVTCRSAWEWGSSLWGLLLPSLLHRQNFLQHWWDSCKMHTWSSKVNQEQRAGEKSWPLPSFLCYCWLFKRS